MRTAGRLDCDTSYSDGMIDLSAADFAVVGGTSALTRNAKGNISQHAGNSQAAIYVCPLSKLIFRSGVMDDTQERFGSGGNQPGPGTNPFGTGSALHGSNAQMVGYPSTVSTSNVSASAGNVSIPVKSSVDFVVGATVAIGSGNNLEYQSIKSLPDATHIQVVQLKFAHTAPTTISTSPFTTPAGVSGRPPYTGVNQLVPVTAPRPKGISFYDLQVRYIVGSANLSSATVGLSKTVYTDGSALAITDILAPAQNGLSLASAATPHVIRIALTAGFQITDDAEFWLEIAATTPGGGTFDLYGAQLRVAYNYN